MSPESTPPSSPVQSPGIVETRKLDYKVSGIFHRLDTLVSDDTMCLIAEEISKIYLQGNLQNHWAFAKKDKLSTTEGNTCMQDYGHKTNNTQEI